MELHTLSGRIGNVVALHACCRFQGRFPAEAEPIYTDSILVALHEGGGGDDQSIGYTLYDAIVSS